MEVREPVLASLPASLLEELGLTPQEENELAWIITSVGYVTLVITSRRDW